MCRVCDASMSRNNTSGLCQSCEASPRVPGVSDIEVRVVSRRFVDWGDRARVGHIPFLVMLQEVELVAGLLCGEGR